MRFHCPKPVDRYEWHPFFTILPRRMTDTEDCVMLEWIERKREIRCGGYDFEFIYRLPVKETNPPF